MLIRYKKEYKKIAMGLLSFMPNEKDLQKLQMTIEQYETEQDRQLYLLKDEKGFIGLIGVLFVDKHRIQILHISVNPSHRGQGVGKKIIMALTELHPDTHFIPDENTVTFFVKCDINELLSTRWSETPVWT